MVRSRIRKSNKGSFSVQTVKEAVDLVIIDGLSIRNAAERKGLARNTLHTYVKKTKNNPENFDLKMSPNYSCRKILTKKKKNL